MRLASNIKGLLPLCAATLFNLSCGCGTEPVPSTTETTLTVSPSGVNANYEAQTAVLSVNATGDWGVSSADKDWCTVTPSGGIKGVSEVKVNLAQDAGSPGQAGVQRRRPSAGPGRDRGPGRLSLGMAR